MARKRAKAARKTAPRTKAARKADTASGVRRTGRKKAGEGHTVRLKTPTDTYVIDLDRFDRKPENNIAQEAMRWTYTLRSRSRWTASEADRATIGRAAADLMERFGIDRNALARMADAGTVEIEIPWTGKEQDAWAPRILPWEYLVAGATSSVRAGRVLTVMRHLRVETTPLPPFPKAPRVLFVVSEPGPLHGYFKFETERDLVRTNLAVDNDRWRQLNSPTSQQLREAVESFRPDVIHLAGVDTHRARTILLEKGDQHALAALEDTLDEGKRSPGDLSDGYILADDSLLPVRGEALGKLLTPGGHRPYFVGFNIGNSAARIAPLVTAAGVRAATGFQDDFDDDLAELFFSVLYARLTSRLILPEAFTAAWQKVHSQPASKEGTGTVLWSAHPLTAKPAQIESQQSRALALSKGEQEAVYPADVATGAVASHVSVKVDPIEDLNYSMLHNQRSLFRSFVIRSHQNRTLRDVRVKVSLFSGAEAAVYERCLDIVPPFVELRRDIHVPLTSILTRSVHESVRTSMTIEVRWGDHLLYLDTSRVRIIPVDQWRDTNEDRKWLPSFVFPRDPAVTHLVDCAQRYMRVLRDDPNAGFDGYQSAEVRRPKTLQQIDFQVQALWSAIVYDLKLGYINPPPSYSRALDSQRLRTPTMIVRDHSGTCIDLALFFAACLELVDIFPAVILLKDHAFPAYWRAERYHTDFKTAHPEDIQNIVKAGVSGTSVANAQPDAWVINAASYREIVALVNDNKLVPIETVRLTENCGFWEAVGAGRDNLADEGDFDSMIDIALAREKQITPLPIMGDQT